MALVIVAKWFARGCHHMMRGGKYRVYLGTILITLKNEINKIVFKVQN